MEVFTLIRFGTVAVNLNFLKHLNISLRSNTHEMSSIFATLRFFSNSTLIAFQYTHMNDLKFLVGISSLFIVVCCKFTQ